jgi:tetratricopeptide (TPR) repeat protein
MPSRLALLSALSIFYFFTLSLTVQAKIHTFRDETTIQVSDPADKPLGEYLAYLVSLRSALLQAEPFIEEQSFVEEAKLSKSKVSILTFLLLQNQLSYLSTAEQKKPLQVVYKTKLDYETLTFPTDISEIYLESIGDWFFVQYLLEQHQKVETDLAQYLQDIARSQDAGYKALLRKTQGKVLNQKYQAFHLYDEVFLFQIKAENLKLAIETMEKIIVLDPDNVAYKLEYAILLAQTESPEHYDRALALMTELIDKVDNDSGVRLVRSLVYFNQGLLMDRALTDVNKVLDTEPDNNFAYLLKGLIALRQSNRNLALKSFASACELTSKNKSDTCNARLLELSNRRGGFRRGNRRNRNTNSRRNHPLGSALKL